MARPKEIATILGQPHSAGSLAAAVAANWPTIKLALEQYDTVAAKLEVDDFVEVIEHITNYVQNERTASYNEGVDSMLDQIKVWMRNKGVAGEYPNELTELLDCIAKFFTPISLG